MRYLAMGALSLTADRVELLRVEGSESLGADIACRRQRSNTPQRGAFVFRAKNEHSVVRPGRPVLRFNRCARFNGGVAKRCGPSCGFLDVFGALFGEFEQR